MNRTLGIVLILLAVSLFVVSALEDKKADQPIPKEPLKVPAPNAANAEKAVPKSAPRSAQSKPAEDPKPTKAEEKPPKLETKPAKPEPKSVKSEDRTKDSTEDQPGKSANQDQIEETKPVESKEKTVKSEPRRENVPNAKDGPKKDEPKIAKPSKSQEPPKIKPIHVALVSGCDSHLSSMTPMAFSLLHHAEVKGKYRVTFVTGSQCRSTADKVGADFFDTGHWNYPLIDPNVSGAQTQRNLSMGPMIYAYPAVEKIVKDDRPDLIVAELWNVRVSLIAEENQIPYATMWAGATPHPAMYQAGYKINSGIAGLYSPCPSNPKWFLDIFAGLFFSQASLVWYFLHAEANALFNQMLQEKGYKKEFQDVFHISNSYPSLATTGSPVFPLQDVPGKFTVTGMQPVEKADPTKMPEDLKLFIENSDKDILYVALGTYAVFTDEQFEIMKQAFMKQQRFNVIWSHSAWNEEKHGKNYDRNRIYIRKKQPQKEIFSYTKTKVFLSHCGSSSMMEGVSNLKVFIGCPQKGDQQLTSQSITIYEFGRIVSSTPSEHEILTVVEDIYQNMATYQKNVKAVREQASRNAVKKLHGWVDEMAKQKKTISFDVEQARYMPIWKASMIISTFLLGMLLTIMTPIVLLIRCFCCRKKKMASEKKTN